MIPIILTAAAAATAPFSVFQRPAADSELAASVSYAAPDPVRSADLLRYGLQRPALPEQIDAWWAEDGASLIAEAVRPRPGLPLGLALQAGQPDLVSVKFIWAVTQSTAN